MRPISVRNSPYFFNPISKMFCNFSLILNMANCRQEFLAFCAPKATDTLNKRKTLWHVTFKRRFGRSHLEVEKIRKFIFFFPNCWYSLIFSPISFNLIWGFSYLQFKKDVLHRLYARHPWRYTVTLNNVCYCNTYFLETQYPRMEILWPTKRIFAFTRALSLRETLFLLHHVLR